MKDPEKFIDKHKENRRRSDCALIHELEKKADSYVSYIFKQTENTDDHLQ